MDGKSPAPPSGVGSGHQVGVRFKAAERALLAEVARSRATTPAGWLRSLALVHLTRRPQWNADEVEGLREVFKELRRIGNNVNQIARALNVAAQKGEYSLYQGEEARAASERVRSEMRRVVAIMTGNFDYWGLPDADRPTASPGAQERDDEATIQERRKLAKLPKRQPARFREG